MRSFHAFVITAGLALIALGCAKSTESSDIGTNTNWMRTCDTSSDCEGNDACLCGVCTRACSESAECSTVHAATSCEVLSETACGAQSAVSSACLQGCDSNGNCTSLEDGRCIAGLCVAEPPTEAPMNDASGAPSDDASIEPANDASVVSNPDPLALMRVDSTVQLTDAYTACAAHSDCRLVFTGCDGCCQRGAINRELENAFIEHFQSACDDYMGVECTCELRDYVARCDAGRCEPVLRETFDCYGPERNEGIAYEPDSVGCNCNELPNKSICTGRTALVCLDKGGAYEWVAVEDGPCWEPEPDPTCADGEVRTTADACLADFDKCHRLANGEYCGESF
jgi:hypothetical protein